jgi:UDP-N-acetylglucosamine 2-epimerase (non-hydrolysing)
MILTGVDPAILLQAIEIETAITRTATTPHGYEVFDFSNRVLRFLVSTARKHKSWKGIRS